MKYAYFPGCKIAHHLPEYGKSVEAVCTLLGLELVKPEFTCCGYPVRHESRDASVYSALRNLALAANRGLDLMTPCKCCFGNFQHARHQIDHDEKLKYRMKNLLKEDGLDFPATTRVRHLLQVLDDNLPSVAGAVSRPLRNLKIACHYGCHALRPENITHFDDPLAPTLFERLITVTGAAALPLGPAAGMLRVSAARPRRGYRGPPGGQEIGRRRGVRRGCAGHGLHILPAAVRGRE